MTKTTLWMVTNWAMAAVGVLIAAVAVGSMFLPPQSARQAPAGIDALPAPAIPIAVAPKSLNTSVEQNQPRSVQTSFTAASIAEPSANASLGQPVSRTSREPGQVVSQPYWSQSGGGIGVIYGVPKPLPPNVIDISKIKPGLGNF